MTTVRSCLPPTHHYYRVSDFNPDQSVGTPVSDSLRSNPIILAPESLCTAPRKYDSHPTFRAASNRSMMERDATNRYRPQRSASGQHHRLSELPLILPRPKHFQKTRPASTSTKISWLPKNPSTPSHTLHTLHSAASTARREDTRAGAQRRRPRCAPPIGGPPRLSHHRQRRASHPAPRPGEASRSAIQPNDCAPQLAAITARRVRDSPAWRGESGKQPRTVSQKTPHPAPV